MSTESNHTSLLGAIGTQREEEIYEAIHRRVYTSQWDRDFASRMYICHNEQEHAFQMWSILKSIIDTASPEGTPKRPLQVLLIDDNNNIVTMDAADVLPSVIPDNYHVHNLVLSLVTANAKTEEDIKDFIRIHLQESVGINGKSYIYLTQYAYTDTEDNPYIDKVLEGIEQTEEMKFRKFHSCLNQTEHRSTNMPTMIKSSSYEEKAREKGIIRHHDKDYICHTEEEYKKIIDNLVNILYRFLKNDSSYLYVNKIYIDGVESKSFLELYLKLIHHDAKEVKVQSMVDDISSYGVIINWSVKIEKSDHWKVIYDIELLSIDQEDLIKQDVRYIELYQQFFFNTYYRDRFSDLKDYVIFREHITSSLFAHPGQYRLFFVKADGVVGTDICALLDKYKIPTLYVYFEKYKEYSILSFMSNEQVEEHGGELGSFMGRCIDMHLLAKHEDLTEHENDLLCIYGEYELLMLHTGLEKYFPTGVKK
nr:MAG TPA: hypothetical protein [Caudoviricetes sp.]